LRKESLEQHDDKQHRGNYEVVVVVTCAAILPLLSHLHSDRVIRCAIRQIIPFSRQSASTAVRHKNRPLLIDLFLEMVIFGIICFYFRPKTCIADTWLQVLQREARCALSKLSKPPLHREHCARDDDCSADDAVRLLCWPPPLLEELKFAAHAASSPPCDAALPSDTAAANAYSLKLHPTQYTPPTLTSALVLHLI